MDVIYFTIGTTLELIIFAVLARFYINSKQTKHIKKLEEISDNLQANDITEDDVINTIRFELDNYNVSVELKLEILMNKIEVLVKGNETITNDQIRNVYRDLNAMSRDLQQKISTNSVTNSRKVTDGDLQSEY